MGLALSIALGIILAPIIFAFIQFVFFGGLGAGAAAAEKTGNPIFGIIVSVAIFVIVGWAITACVG